MTDPYLPATSTMPYNEYLVLATATLLGLAAQTALLVIGFIASYHEATELARPAERYAFALIFIPVAAVILEEAAWMTSKWAPNPELIKTPSWGWIAIATLAPSAAFGTYALALGTMVAFQTEHHAWAITLAVAAIASFSATLMAATVTTRKTIQSR